MTFGLVQTNEKNGISDGCQAIDDKRNDEDDEEGNAINVRFLERDIESKTARVAVRAVLELGGLSARVLISVEGGSRKTYIERVDGLQDGGGLA